MEKLKKEIRKGIIDPFRPSDKELCLVGKNKKKQLASD